MQRAVSVLLAALLLVASVAFAAAGKVNVNAASAAELQQVPGIDANIAVRIVARRTAQGPFRKLDDLLEVPGFSKMVMISAADHLELGPAAPVAAAPLGSAAANGKKLDLNKASFKDLLLLPEMTPRGAKSILDYREANHGFHSVDELERVPGLDKRLIVQLVDQVEVTAARAAGTQVAATPAETPGGDTATLGEGGWNGSWVSKIEATPTPNPQETAKPGLAPGEKVDLNTAERADLEKLPDIGPVMSQRILEYRTKNGPFKSPDGLLQVRGIGAQRLAAIRPYVTTGGRAVAASTPRPKATPVAVAAETATPRPRATAETPHATPKPTQVAKASTAKAILPDGRVNINVAGVDDLLTLPRMTREAAAEIVAFRAKNGPFHDPHGITDVPTIGEATYARIREKIAVSE